VAHVACFEHDRARLLNEYPGELFMGETIGEWTA